MFIFSKLAGKFSRLNFRAGKKILVHTIAGASVLLIASASKPKEKSSSSEIRGLFVDKLPALLKDPALQNEFLSSIQTQNFNHLVLYNLHQVLEQPDLKALLPGFIRSCREQGVITIAAAGESAGFFESKILPYQKLAGQLEKFDNFYLEFEFWRGKEAREGGMYANYISQNNLPADTSGLFTFYRYQLTRINSLAKAGGVKTSTYVGWLNSGQAGFIAKNTDQVWVHAYFRDPNHLFKYSESRLKMLAGNQAEVYPIFSAEPEFSGPWAESSAFSQNLYSDFVVQAGTQRNAFNNGYMWFAQSFLLPRLQQAPVTVKF